MPLRIEHDGPGHIGKVSEGWNMSLVSSHPIMGEGGSGTGSVSFTAKGDESTKFTIDDAVSIDYTPIQRAATMPGFLGNIRSVSGEHSARFTMSSIAGLLDVERDTIGDPTGTYAGITTLPEGIPYTVAGVQYLTSGQGVVLAVDARTDYEVLVLATDPGRSGADVVYRFSDVDGTPHWDTMTPEVYPVYSDAADLTAPGNVNIARTLTNTYIVQAGNKRVKIFSADTGAFVSQFGSSGTGNGQFTDPFGIASDGTVVWVGDRVQGRAQRFSLTGTYQAQFGTSSGPVGDGLTFVNMNHIYIFYGINALYISDHTARVRLYDYSGVYEPSATIGSTSATVNDGFFETGKDISINRFGMIAWQGSRGWKIDLGVAVAEWSLPLGVHGAFGMSGNDNWLSGIVPVGNGFARVIMQPRSRSDYIRYYCAVANPEVQVTSINQLIDDYAIPSWRGNVWSMIRDLCSVAGIVASVHHGRLFFVKLDNNFRADFVLPNDIEPTSVDLDSRDAARAIKITNQRAVNANSVSGVLYDSTNEGNPEFDINVNGISYVTIKGGGHPWQVFQPTPKFGIPQNGYYLLRDADGNDFLSEWTNYGGKVLAEIGKNPGEIDLTIFGPGIPLPGYKAPYTIHSLIIVGTGVVVNPIDIEIGTGVPEVITSRDFASSTDSPFVSDAQIAYTQGSWIAYASGTPTQRVTFRISTKDLPGNAFNEDYILSTNTWSAGMVGGNLWWRDAKYNIDDVTISESVFVLECSRYTTQGKRFTAFNDDEFPSPEDIWAGKTAGDFDTYWAGYTAQDYTIAPQRNPYNITLWPNGVRPGAIASS